MTAPKTLAQPRERSPNLESGLVRRYEFSAQRDGGTFAAFAASMLAELDAVPDGETLEVTRPEGRSEEGR